MEVQLVNRKIQVIGASKFTASFASIPGSRWDKRSMTWTYPPSPVAAVRISQAAKMLGEPLTLHPSMNEVVQEWIDMKRDLVWKTTEGISAAKKTLEHVNPFFTDTTPWIHQVCAGAFIEYKKAWYLAMEMGTGKTLVAINRLLAHPVRSCLILCPKSVIDVWVAEFELHAPGHPYRLIPLAVAGGKKKLDTFYFQQAIAEKKKEPYIVIVNYDAFIRDPLLTALRKEKWGMVIADEGHKLKAPGGKTSREAAKLVADSKGILSGTPLPNDRRDAYGQFRFLDPAAYGTSMAKFRIKYCEMGGFQNYQVVGWKNEEHFNKVLDLYMFRVDKSVLDLPDTVHMYRHAPLTVRGRHIYTKLEKHFISEIEAASVVTADNVLAKSMKLREICCGFLFDDEHNLKPIHEERKKVLQEILEDLPPEEKVVVFAEFVHDLKCVQEVADDCGRVYGEVSSRRNDLERGRYPRACTVLGINPKSGGLGVDCTSSRYCIFYSVSYNGGDHDQAKARLHRGGQNKEVTYIYLIAPNTIEEVVYDALIHKKKVTDEIMKYVKEGGSRGA